MILTNNIDSGKSTTFLCGHVLRIISELKNSNRFLKISGFIHIPQFANEQDFFSILFQGIKGIKKSLINKNEITIMITGFTNFKKVTDNYTSKYLFGDGTIDNSNFLGIQSPSNILKDLLIKEFESISINEKINVNTKKQVINIFFVRLPVDDNLESDNTGKILKEIFDKIKPNAILSFGIGIYPKDNPEQNIYHIETRSYGMKNYIYETNESFIDNKDLLTIYKTALT